MSKLSRNDPCHCGSGKKYKQCHLDEDEAADRAARADARAADGAAIARVEMKSKPLGPRFWGLCGLGVVVAVAVAFAKDPGAGLVVAAAWALGMVAWAVIRDPPPPRPDAPDPAALSFGMEAPKEKEAKKIRQPRQPRPR